MQKRFVVISLFALLLGWGSMNSSAQGNLVINGDMESGFSARDNVTGVPLGWAFYLLNGKADADRQAFAPYSHSSPTFWSIRSTYSTFVAGGYQTIAVVKGTTYRFGVFAFIWSCNDNQYSCIKDDGIRFSNTESNMRVRIGIDTVGGVDPNSGNIAWGPFVQPWDGYQGLTVDAVAQGDFVTVFLQADSGQAMVFNEAYWDDATLTAVAPAPNVVAAPNQAVVAAPAASGGAVVSADVQVPFVSPQQARADGSVVHRVQAGDTFLSILVAYDNLGISQESVMQLNGWRFVPDFISIGEDILILPPGSVNPATGQVLNPAGGTGTTQTAAASTPANTTNQAPAADVQQTAPPLTTQATRTLSAADIAALQPVEAIDPFLP